MPPYKTYTGVSKKGFEEASKLAVAKYEKDWGVPKKPVRLNVVEMYVTVTNPVRDYRVVLGPGG